MVVADGLEPSTPALSRRCSNQLSYATVEGGGAGRSRTDDILLAKQALYQLSYGPVPRNSARLRRACRRGGRRLQSSQGW